MSTIITKKNGRVKWYNIDLLYGFITDYESNEDIFIHKNNIGSTVKYKCLFKGEYVQYETTITDKGKQCINVRGINNGELLCESNPDLLKKLILCNYIEKVNPNLAYFKI